MVILVPYSFLCIFFAIIVGCNSIIITIMVTLYFLWKYFDPMFCLTLCALVDFIGYKNYDTFIFQYKR